jgi:4-amino-4-deoxy-L-arabinose transferase-like glycosyltransferase
MALVSPMPDLMQPLPAAHRPRLPGGSWWLMAALMALLLILAALRPLALPDEGRYGEIGRWMALSGDWLAPRLNGLPFFHKPPLLYWLEAASVTLLGATPWALRLIPALHAGLMMLALFLATRAFSAGNDRLARRAALMLGSSPAFLFGGQYINHDMLVAAWISVAIWCYAAAFLHGDKPHTGWALAGYAACALGILSKGLIGLALPGLVLFVWLLWTRQFGKVWRLPWLRGLLLFALLTVPWFVLIERRFPGALAYLFGVQQFSRYVGSGFNNVQPWWFYLAGLIVLLFPWTFFAVYQGVAQARQRRQRALPADSPVPRQVLLLCWIWIAAIVLFFTIPKSKLIGYVLPVMPPLALLAAVGWGNLFDGRRRAARAWLMGLAAITPIAVLTLSLIGERYFPNLARSSKSVAQALACAAAPGDPVYVLDRFPYDLPFYAQMTQPLIAVQNWPKLRATAGDDWTREMFEAGDFDPARAALVLQSPPAALEAARTTPRSWVVTPANTTLKIEGFRQITRDRHWALYASPATPLTAKGPEAAEHPGLPGCQRRRDEPRQ